MHCLNRGNYYLVNAHCNVKENNERKKETYKATWLDLVMETRPEEKTTLFENDSSRKETYEQKQVVHFLVQRNPKQRIRMGKHGKMMTEYQLPYKKVLRVPIFTPSKAASPNELNRVPSPSGFKSIMEYETNGVCTDKQEVSNITKDLPKVTQPIHANFRASCLISPSEESHSFKR